LLVVPTCTHTAHTALPLQHHTPRPRAYHLPPLHHARTTPHHCAHGVNTPHYQPEGASHRYCHYILHTHAHCHTTPPATSWRTTTHRTAYHYHHLRPHTRTAAPPHHTPLHYYTIPTCGWVGQDGPVCLLHWTIAAATHTLDLATHAAHHTFTCDTTHLHTEGRGYHCLHLLPACLHHLHRHHCYYLPTTLLPLPFRCHCDALHLPAHTLPPLASRTCLFLTAYCRTPHTAATTACYLHRLPAHHTCTLRLAYTRRGVRRYCIYDGNSRCTLLPRWDRL